MLDQPELADGAGSHSFARMHTIIGLLFALCLSGLTGSAASALELNAQAMKDLAAAAEKLSKDPKAPKAVTVIVGGKPVILGMQISPDGGLTVAAGDGSFTSKLKFAYDQNNELVVQVKDPGQPVRYVRTQGDKMQGWAVEEGDDINVTLMSTIFAEGKTVTTYSEGEATRMAALEQALAKEGTTGSKAKKGKKGKKGKAGNKTGLAEQYGYSTLQEEFDSYMFGDGKYYSAAVFAVVNQNNANLTQQIVSGTLSGAVNP